MLPPGTPAAEKREAWEAWDGLGRPGTAACEAPQLLGYYLALLRGHDPDKPRNLAKSVTVK